MEKDLFLGMTRIGLDWIRTLQADIIKIVEK